MSEFIRDKRIAAVVGVVIVVLVVGSGFFLISGTSENATPYDQATPAPGETIYFGKYSPQDGNLLVDVQTGATRNFIDPDYSLLGAQGYQIFPTFLMLKKDGDFYWYNVKDETTKNISDLFDELSLAENEEARVYPSITEKDHFMIRIDALDLSQVSEFDNSSPILSTRLYAFDASNDTLSTITNEKVYGCAEYDSKNQRLFIWPCGEGIGSAGPLSIYDLDGNIQGQVITARDFGATVDELVHIKSNQGLFFALYRGSASIKILVLYPAPAEPSKEIYVATEQVNSQISNLYAYSMGMDRITNTLIIGGAHDILLLRFDADKQIVQSARIPDKGVYANFIFPNAGKLYYKANRNIRVVDLDSWQIERSIPSPAGFVETTLFSF